MKYCPNCGSEYLEAFFVCDECKTDLVYKPYEEVAPLRGRQLLNRYLPRRFDLADVDFDRSMACRIL